MDDPDYKYSGIIQKIIGCAMKVHSHFGMGFPEIVYKRAFVIELKAAVCCLNLRQKEKFISSNI